MWIAFGVIVGVMLWLDLFVIQKKAHAVGMREAVFWSVVWILVALAFNVGVLAFQGTTRGIEFLTAYLIERSLSIDNLFVFILLFQFFRVPLAYQQKTLMIGILGALVMRATFIAFGIALLEAFEPIIYVFGALLIYSAYKMIAEKDKEIDPEKNPVIRLFRRIIPMTNEFHGEKFFVKDAVTAKRIATPLVLVLAAIAMFDLVFAIDSIPAVLAVSEHPFIIYTSNVFAVLGLRAMYFALAGFVGMFRYLSYGLAVILAFIGVKLLITHFYHFPIVYALGVVLGVLTISVIASIVIPDKGKGHGAAPSAELAPDAEPAKTEPPAHR